MFAKLTFWLCLATTACSTAATHIDQGVSFQLSEGTLEARSHFMQGLVALHSFWYDEATREFDAAIAADPTMNMAYWGAAFSRCKLLWGADDLSAARHLLARMPDPDHLSEREQAWVLALVALLKAGDVRASRERYATAMEDLDQRFHDDESETFLALALLSKIRPGAPNEISLRLRAGLLALDVLGRHPNHPGATHYLIHAYDVPQLAPMALPFAYAYARIAPAAFHARHMPAHIFARLGLWEPAIASCRSAWDVSVESARREHLSVDHRDFHSLNWLIEMSFEIGRRKDADASMKLFVDAIRDGAGASVRAQYATQVASYLVRTGEWTRVDELLAPLASVAPHGDDTSAHCGTAPAPVPNPVLEQMAVLDTRSRAAAMTKDVDKARHLLDELDDARAKLRSVVQTMQPPEVVAKLDAAAARYRRALLARASGDDVVLLAVLRESVDDDIELGGEINPNGYLVREEIARTLVRLGKADAAVAEYMIVIAEHPGRARALLGAARATINPKAARDLYAQLLQVWSNAEADTDGLAEAKAATK